jgi:predicted alpha/beta-fold hydrolase
MKPKMLPTTLTSRADSDMSWVEFEPHHVLKTGHAQTLAAFFLSALAHPERAHKHHVLLDDEDSLVLHDDRPADWQPGDRVAILIHGVCGTHRSPYCVRVARRLNGAGIRTFRIDLRGCGAGESLARKPYHGGCSPDLLAAVRWLTRVCPGSPITVLGFSLGGNITLKMLGEAPELIPPEVDQAVAVSPPIDILETARQLKRGSGRFYDHYFAGLLYKQLLKRRRLRSDLMDVKFRRRPRTVWEFDDVFTAPLGGFASAEDYYQKCSSALVVQNITTPTLVIMASNDPLIPVAPFQAAPWSPAVTLRMTNGGGHLGFIGRRTADPDRHWMDWRVVEWMKRGS